MQLFYAPDINGDTVELLEEEARHALQVLRKRVGDEIDLVDGLGSFYKGEIIERSKKKCLIKIRSAKKVERKGPRFSIAIAPTKNMDRMEWMVEKATEIGVDEIIPILCERSERKRIRLDRLQKIVLGAMKQSQRAYLPKVRALTNFYDLIGEQYDGYDRYIAYCSEEALPHLKDRIIAGRNTLVFIGPEGDFSASEVTTAKENKIIGVSLGENRLRTETAGILAVTLLNVMQK